MRKRNAKLEEKDCFQSEMCVTCDLTY